MTRRSSRPRKQPQSIYPVHQNEENKNPQDSVLPQKRQLSRKSRSRIKKLRVVQESKHENGSDSEEEEIQSSNIFAAIEHSNTAMNSIVSEWIDRFQMNAEEASMELLNFIIQCCGAQSNRMTSVNELKQLDYESIMDTIAQDLRERDEKYPLEQGTSKMKKQFQQNLKSFWYEWMVQLFQQMDVFQTTIYEDCINWLIALSSAEIRAIRHTCTFIVFEISIAIIHTLRESKKQLITLERQLRGIGKKKSTKKSQQLEQNLQRYTDLKEVQLGIMETIYNGIFLHRYRDVMPELRVESMHALGYWILHASEEYLKDTYLRYLGWWLNDEQETVRAAALTNLVQIYRQFKDSTDLVAFTTRFQKRFIELCSDINANVVHLALQLVTLVDRSGQFDWDTSEIAKIETLLFNQYHRKIRNEAANFICLQYQAFGVAPVSQERSDFLKIQAIALIEFFESHITTEDTILWIDYAMDAFWDNPDFPIVHEWGLLADLLMADERLSFMQQLILTRMLFSIILLAADSKTNELDQISLHMIPLLSVSFIRFQSEPSILNILIQFPQFLNREGEALHKEWKEALEHLRDCYFRQTDSVFMEQSVKTLQHCQQPEGDVAIKTMVRDMIHTLHHDIQKSISIFHSKLSNAAEIEYQLMIQLRRFFYLSKVFDSTDQFTLADIATLLECICLWLSELDPSKIDTNWSTDNFVLEGLRVVLISLIWVVRPYLVQENKQMEEEIMQQLIAIQKQLYECFETIFQFTNDMLLFQSECFLLYCEFRCIYCSHFAIVQLRWDESKIPQLVSNLQRFFTAFTQSDHPKQHIIKALIRSNLCNAFHHQQAAAIVQYILDENKEIVELIKVFMKQLKDHYPVRYMELQMTVLRNKYEENRMDIFVSLSKALSKNIGIGEIPVSLHPPFLQFIKEGFRFSFEENHLSFLEGLRYYVKRLTVSELAIIQQEYTQDIQQLIHHQDNMTLKGIYDMFQQTSTKVSKQLSMASETSSQKSPEPPSDAEE